MSDTQQIFEFRGVDKFHFAEVIKDDDTGYVTATPIHIPVQEIGKSTDSSSEAHYYDNKAMIVVNSESADTITLTIAPPALEILSKLQGKSFDETTGMMVDCPKQNKYYAITYRTKGTDGGYRYVTRLKGQFNIPDETNHTEDDSTDTNNTQITFTGIYTEYEFDKGIYKDGQWEKSGAKGIVVDERYGLADVSNFFNSIQTPDSVMVKGSVAVTGVTISDATATITTGSTKTLTATVAPEDATNKSVRWTSSDDAIASVDDEGVVTAVAAGSATITVTTVDGNFTAICAVTVEAATIAVTGVTVSPESDTISLASTPAQITCTATVAPADATDKSVTWSSSDEAVATVDSDGVVTALTVGNTTITATTTDGSFTDTCVLTVTA